MKDAYFPHDYGARSDEKVIRLLQALGAEGYGLYWLVVEKLYEAEGRIAHDFALIAYDLRADEAKVRRMVEDFGLFFFEGGNIGSHSVDRRLAERSERIDKARMAGRASAIARGERALNGSSANAQPISKQVSKQASKTTAPSAVDLTGEAVKANDARLLEAKMDRATLPFDFGDFTKGVRIQDLPTDTCQAILKRMPRLSGDLGALLRLRVDQRSERMTTAQRRAQGEL